MKPAEHYRVTLSSISSNIASMAHCERSEQKPVTYDKIYLVAHEVAITKHTQPKPT
jgi:hypothetical protein